MPLLRDTAVLRGVGQGAWSLLCPRLQQDPRAQPWHPHLQVLRGAGEQDAPSSLGTGVHPPHSCNWR